MFSVVSTDLREVQLIAWTTLGFGILLWVADTQGSRARTEEQLRWSDAVWIGSAQCLALVPGVSRAGIVMTAALALGLQRTAARTSGFPFGNSDDCRRRDFIPAKIFARNSSSGLGGVNPGCLGRGNFRLAVHPLLPAPDRANRDDAVRAVPGGARRASTGFPLRRRARLRAVPRELAREPSFGRFAGQQTSRRNLEEQRRQRARTGWFAHNPVRAQC